MSAGVIDIPRLQALPTNRAHTLAVLDVGSSKICCIVVRLKPREVDGAAEQKRGGRSHEVQVLGFGLHKSEGITRGLVTEMDPAERAIRSAVDAAERMAGVTVESVIVGTAAGRMSSEAFEASIRIGGPGVGHHDVARVVGACHAQFDADKRTPLHVVPAGYAIDGEGPVRDPRGMIGEELSANVHVVSAQTAALRNLLLCIEQAHLGIETLVATPYASGLGALSPDEMALGAVIIDMGAGTTSMAVFVDGRFHFADVIAIGGQHVSNDIARGLGTGVEAAERLKTLFGSAISTGNDRRDLITVPPVDGRDGYDVPSQVPRAFISDIIRSRIDEVFEVCRDRLAAHGFAGLAAQKLVLTGGGSQLAGVLEVAEHILRAKARIGRPYGMNGLPEAAHGPGFAAAIGLAVYPQVAAEEDHRHVISGFKLTGTDGYLSRVGHWIRESF